MLCYYPCYKDIKIHFTNSSKELDLGNKIAIIKVVKPISLDFSNI